MKKPVIALSLLLSAAFSHAQTGNAGIGTITPHSSARLEVSSTNQGFLVPRMTAAQRAGISNPAAGLMVYQTDATPNFYYYDGNAWMNFTGARVGVGGYLLGVTTFAGSGTEGYSDGVAAAASFYDPSAVAVDAAGNVYVAEEANNRIRKITQAGVVTTFAGNGTYGSYNANGTLAAFSSPCGLAFDAAGNLYVADRGNNLIRKINPAGDVTTFAGSGGYGSNDGIASGATFKSPSGVAVDAAGNVYVADKDNHKIRIIYPAGFVGTFSGSGIAGFEDNTALVAKFNSPVAISIDGSGYLYVADQNNYRVRKISTTGTVGTLAGNGSTGGTDGPIAIANFGVLTGIAVNAAGIVTVADKSNNKVRTITQAGTISTLAGAFSTGSSDGPGISARFNSPVGIGLDAVGNVYVTEHGNDKIRKILTY